MLLYIIFHEKWKHCRIKLMPGVSKACMLCVQIKFITQEVVSILLLHISSRTYHTMVFKCHAWGYYAGGLVLRKKIMAIYLKIGHLYIDCHRFEIFWYPIFMWVALWIGENDWYLDNRSGKAAMWQIVLCSINQRFRTASSHDSVSIWNILITWERVTICKDIWNILVNY